MYIEGDGVYHGDSARMMSPVCNSLGTQCMTFWYHMYGLATSMMLNVYLLEDNHVTKIWSRSNSQGNHWHLAQTEINPLGPFQVCIGYANMYSRSVKLQKIFNLWIFYIHHCHLF